MVGDGDKRLFRPPLEPINGAAADEARELQGPVAELLADWREAEDQMQMLTHSLQKVFVEDLGGRDALGMLLFHWRDQQVADLFDFVAREQARDHATGQNIVYVLQEAFLFDVLVREYECDSFAFLACCSVQQLQVVEKIVHSVSSD